LNNEDQPGVHTNNKRYAEKEVDVNDYVPIETIHSKKKRTKKELGSCVEIDLLRVAIGNKVYSHLCRLKVEPESSDPFIAFYFAEEDSILKEEEV